MIILPAAAVRGAEMTASLLSPWAQRRHGPRLPLAWWNGSHKKRGRGRDCTLCLPLRLPEFMYRRLPLMNSQVLMWEWRKKKTEKEATANRKSKNLPHDVIAIDPTADDGEESSTFFIWGYEIFMQHAVIGAASAITSLLRLVIVKEKNKWKKKTRRRRSC